MTEKQELMAARLGAGVAVVAAGYLGMNPPGFVAQVVAFAFGLAAASFFPAIIWACLQTDEYRGRQRHGRGHCVYGCVYYLFCREPVG